MNSIDLARIDSPAFRSFENDEEHFEYRSVSKAAVACVVFAFMSLLAFVLETLVLLPLAGVVFGVAALINLRRYSRELTGKNAAVVGLIVNVTILLAATAYHTTIYLTEVPEGYQRMLFSELRPRARSQELFSARAQELDGQKVFVRGYILPGLESRNLDRFMLVGDMGTCCFGGSPKITDVIAVKIVTDQRVDYRLRRWRIGGNFKVNTTAKLMNHKSVPAVIYEIEADVIK
jgi:hypothetical protein